MSTIQTIQQLCGILNLVDHSDLVAAEAVGLPIARGEIDYSSLPVFSEREPGNTLEVWSYSDTHVLRYLGSAVDAHGNRWVLEPRQTIAEEIAERYADDGQTFERISHTGERVSLYDECEASIETRGGDISQNGFDKTAYRFIDGSVITVAGDGWDLGYEGCYCWRGVGHREGCDSKEV